MTESVKLKDQTKKTDPADAIRNRLDEQKSLADMKSFDIGNLDLSDFKAIPKRAARTPQPFEGYPLKPKVKIGTADISATYIVGLKPTEEPPEDPSGRGRSIFTNGNERIVNLGTYHSRMIRNPVLDQNMDVVFDRELILKGGGRLYVAVVPDHYVRAQVIFFYDTKSERIEIDPRYTLLDVDQSSRLRLLFQQIINPKLRLERQARMVSGEVETNNGAMMTLPAED